jgi:NitT/TauT family transport system permease protein
VTGLSSTTPTSSQVEALAHAGESPTVRANSRAHSIFLGVVPPLVAFGCFVGIAYLFSYVFLSPDRRFLMPPPHDVVSHSFFRGNVLREQLNAMWDTAQVSIVGLVIAFAIGSTIAIVMSQAKWIERALYPYAVIVQVTPILAIVPLIALWFGYDFTARVVVCVLISIFPIVTNTLFGLLRVEANLHDLFTLHHSSRVKRLLKLQLPHAIPDIFIGLRIAAGLSVIGAIVGEFFFRQGTPGLGRLLDTYRAFLQTDLLMGALFWACFLGIVSFWITGFVANLLTRNWYEERR